MEIALSLNQQLEQHLPSPNSMDPVAINGTPSAETLVIATSMLIQYISLHGNVTPKRATMQPNPSASVALTANAITFRCQKVEIAWTFLSSFQQHPPIPTGLDSVATKHELYANAIGRMGFIVSAMMNVYPDVNISESEEGDGVWGLIQILF